MNNHLSPQSFFSSHYLLHSSSLHSFSAKYLLKELNPSNTLSLKYVIHLKFVYRYCNTWQYTIIGQSLSLVFQISILRFTAVFQILESLFKC